MWLFPRWMFDASLFTTYLSLARLSSLECRSASNSVPNRCSTASMSPKAWPSAF